MTPPYTNDSGQPTATSQSNNHRQQKLLHDGDNGSQQQQQQQQPSFRQKAVTARVLELFLVLSFVGIALVAIGSKEAKNSAFGGATTTTNKKSKEESDTRRRGGCDSTTLASSTAQWLRNDTSIWNPTVASDYSQILAMMLAERQKLDTHLATDYGSSYYRSLFYQSHNVSRGKLAAFDPSHQHGWESMIRRIQLKILEVQQDVLLLQEEERIHQLKQKKEQMSFCPPAQVRWVFAVSGHSSSAGHGNLDDQSYASVLERALSPLLGSLGITFESRNYGMSGKSSAPEVALCQEAIFGADVDVMTWDTAQTDQTWFLEVWMQRAASSMQNRPVLMAAHASQSRYGKIFERVWDQNGPFLPWIIMDEKVVQEMEAAVPDTLLTEDLPPLLKYLKCNGDVLEVNEPCKFEKYDGSICPGRAWQTGWHPGYRRLALYGNLLALMHADAVDEAIRELIRMTQPTMMEARDSDATVSPTGTKVSLRQIQELKSILQQQERQAKADQQATKTENPETGGGVVDWPKHIPGVPPSWYFHSPGICRTARLPSQQRYKGILTGGQGVPYIDEQGFIPAQGLERMEIVSSSMAKNETTASNSSEAVLDFAVGYDWNMRGSQRGCNVSRTNRDFADFFYVTDREWRRAILPSPAELNEYGPKTNQNQNQNQNNQTITSTTHEYHGLVFICPFHCKSMQKICRGDELAQADWPSRLEIRVNGLEARLETEFVTKDCLILSRPSDGEEGLLPMFVFPPRNDGTWDLQVRIKPPANEDDTAKIFQINSIVLM